MEINNFLNQLQNFCKQNKFKLKKSNVYKRPDLFHISLNRKNKLNIYSDDLFNILNNNWNEITRKDEFHLIALKFVRKYDLIHKFNKEE